MVCFMNEIYLVLILLSSNCRCDNAQQDTTTRDWPRPVSKTTTNANGIGVTVDYMKFKHCLYHYGSMHVLYSKHPSTKAECGILCMEHSMCLTWTFKIGNPYCHLYDYRFQSNPFKTTVYAKSSNSELFYEVEVSFHASF